MNDTVEVVYVVNGQEIPTPQDIVVVEKPTS